MDRQEGIGVLVRKVGRGDKEQEQVQGSGRDWENGEILLRRKISRTKVRKARREFDARVGAHPKCKINQTPFVNGRNHCRQIPQRP